LRLQSCWKRAPVKLPGREFDPFGESVGVQLVPLDKWRIEIARSARRELGKGVPCCRSQLWRLLLLRAGNLLGRGCLAQGADFSLADIVLCA